MSNLHAYFALKNEKAFTKALEASRAQAQPPTPSSSAGKRSMTMISANAVDVNTRDWLGRTVLHIACSVTEPYALSYVRLLLARPGINVNIQDVESRWTALHRALYVGNISACQLLLRRFDIDIQLRDNEGLTAFDLYNLTVEGTRPLNPASVSPGSNSLNEENMAADLFTWGGNRNAALGHRDSKDRTYPDYVSIQRQDGANDQRNKFTPVQVKAISMAKLHTTVITNEKGPNLRVCGFGSGGRLGPTHHTQYTLLSIPQIPHTVTAVAPAQDHTLALTSRNEVWSWGLNRFSQLGYIVELSSLSASSGSAVRLGAGSNVEEPIQHVPKRVAGVLKKEDVMGIAACKMASACWTKGEVFTWGTNSGQLGYDSAGQVVQILPRKVTGVQDAIGIALTDTAMACLLTSHDIICFRENTRFRIKFPPLTPSISSLQPYAPPLPSKTPITKITACEGLFGALSIHGDVWTFSVPATGVSGVAGVAVAAGVGIGEGDKERERGVVKPQRVWTARRSIDPARDIALGSDGDLIVCTESGHVFVRSRVSTSSASTNTSTSTHTNSTKSFPGGTAAIPITIGPTQTTSLALSVSPPAMTLTTMASMSSSSTPATTKGRFHRVPFIHRAIAVCANSAGAFGALRLNYVAKKVDLDGGEGSEGVVVGEDLGRIAPWRGAVEEVESREAIVVYAAESEEEEREDGEVFSQPRSPSSYSARRLIELIDQDRRSRKATGRGILNFEARAGVGTGTEPGTGELPYGADMLIKAQSGISIPVHRLILAARSTVLKDLFNAGGGILRGGDEGFMVSVTYRCVPNNNRTLGKGTAHPHPYLTITNIRPLPVLLLLEFMYSDVVPILDTLTFVEATQVRREASALARLIGVGDLLAGDGRRLKTVEPTLGKHLWYTFETEFNSVDTPIRVATATPSPVSLSSSAPSSTRADVLLQLSDTVVTCHSLILRARCTFFQHFFEEEAWTVNRWNPDGTIRIDLEHMGWRPVRYALMWIYGVGEGEAKDGGLFDEVDDVDSLQDLIDLLFDVMAVASELLLDRLLLLCSNALLEHITLTNVHFILARATYLNALPLVASLHDYITVNLEGLMETRLLDREYEDQVDAESNNNLIPALGTFIRARQADNAPFIHRYSKVIMDEALNTHAKWLEERDIPGPIVRSQGQWPSREKNSPRLVFSARRASEGLRSSPPVGADKSGIAAGDDIFVMEDVSGTGGGGAIIPPLNIGESVNLLLPKPPETYVVPKITAWGGKAGGTGGQSRVDMKTIMAETKTETLTRTPRGPGELSESTTTPSQPSSPGWTQKTPQRERRQIQASVASKSVSGSISNPNPSRSSSASPWHIPFQQASTATRIQGGNSPRGNSPQAKGCPVTPSSVLHQAANPASRLGPVVSPVIRTRRAPSDRPAWNTISGPQPTTSTSASTFASAPTPTTTVSFAAIQQQQIDQGHSKEKRSLSLREIQEEERAKREEETFMKWWAAEEERIKAEQQEQATGTSVVAGPGGGSSHSTERQRRGGVRRGGRGRAAKG